MADEKDEIVVCVGKITKVENVPLRNGIPEHTESLIDFTGDAKLFIPGSSYGTPSRLEKLAMDAELRYGKKYEIVLREIKPKVALSGNSRNIRASNE